MLQLSWRRGSDAHRARTIAVVVPQRDVQQSAIEEHTYGEIVATVVGQYTLCSGCDVAGDRGGMCGIAQDRFLGEPGAAGCGQRHYSDDHNRDDRCDDGELDRGLAASTVESAHRIRSVR